jgi:hypothetical protein
VLVCWQIPERIENICEQLVHAGSCVQTWMRDEVNICRTSIDMQGGGKLFMFVGL